MAETNWPGCSEDGCEEPAEVAAVDMQGRRWAAGTPLCTRHRREREGWDRSDYEAEARRLLDEAWGYGAQAIEEFEKAPVRDSCLRLAEISVQAAAVYAQLAQRREPIEVFPPGAPLKPFPGYRREPAEPT